MFHPLLKSFAHGVHPPELKADTRALPIRQFPFAPLLTIPLLQHIGKPARAVVREGQEIARGQRLAEADGFNSVALHAPASGTIRKLALAPIADGREVPSIYLEPFPASTQEVVEGSPCPLEESDPADILHAMQQAGIVGLGGAAFPTHVKLAVPKDATIDTLIVNGAECEPYLTTDHRVMLEQTADVILGTRYVLKATGAPRAIIAVEANKADAAAALRAAIPSNAPISIEVLEVKYPQGAEKILIKALLGREVPSGGHAYTCGVVTVNVATAAEIGRLLPRGRGIQERVITFTGPAIEKKGNYRVPLGTPLRFALDHVGVTDALSMIFLGGPMMGQSVANLDVPLTKGIGGVVAYSASETTRPMSPLPCIHCARCVDACPVNLNPCQLGLLAKQHQYATMSERFHLHDCFECGACSYVCPSHIPLTHQFRVAKQALKRQRSV